MLKAEWQQPWPVHTFYARRSFEYLCYNETYDSQYVLVYKLQIQVCMS